MCLCARARVRAGVWFSLYSLFFGMRWYSRHIVFMYYIFIVAFEPSSCHSNIWLVFVCVSDAQPESEQFDARGRQTNSRQRIEKQHLSSVPSVRSVY